jgi:hypothetical protein
MTGSLLDSEQQGGGIAAREVQVDEACSRKQKEGGQPNKGSSVMKAGRRGKSEHI